MLLGVNTGRRVDDLNLPLLADEIRAAVGEPVSLNVMVDGEGNAVLDVLSPTGGRELPVTLAQFRSIVGRHVRRPPAPSALAVLNAALPAANTVGQLTAALLAWTTAELGSGTAEQRRNR